MPDITFVDENDCVIGHGPKSEAITNKIAHRIVRIFVFNPKGELLIQKRAANVDVPNRWDQSAAGHVDMNEDYLTAAIRELCEEVGISGTKLKEIAKYYAEETDDSIIRKRFNVLYTTAYEGKVAFEDSEVSDIKWIDPDKLEQWMQEKPEEFTQGFVKSFGVFRKHTRKEKDTSTAAIN